MLKIDIIATGSKGNCYAISDGAERILIDPGISIKEIQKALNFGVSDLKFCLLSHEHKDHSKSIKDILKLGLDCYMSAGTRDALGLKHSSVLLAHAACDFESDGWLVLPFNTQHDAAEPVGFLIQSPSGKKIVYATDTYYIKYVFSGVTHWMVEANYSETLLQKNNDLDIATKSRIRTSHFEIQNLKKFFAAQDLSATEKIYLIHLSDQNSDENLFVTEIETAIGKPVYLCDSI